MFVVLILMPLKTNNLQEQIIIKTDESQTVAIVFFLPNFFDQAGQHQLGSLSHPPP